MLLPDHGYMLHSLLGPDFHVVIVALIALRLEDGYQPVTIRGGRARWDTTIDPCAERRGLRRSPARSRLALLFCSSELLLLISCRLPLLGRWCCCRLGDRVTACRGDGTELKRLLSCVGHAHGRALHWLDLHGDGGDCVDEKVHHDGFGRRTPLRRRERTRFRRFRHTHRVASVPIPTVIVAIVAVGKVVLRLVAGKMVRPGATGAVLERLEGASVVVRPMPAGVGKPVGLRRILRSRHRTFSRPRPRPTAKVPQPSVQADEMCEGAEAITQASPPRPRSARWVSDEEIKHCFELAQPELFVFQHVFGATGLLSAEKGIRLEQGLQGISGGFSPGPDRAEGEEGIGGDGRGGEGTWD